MDDGVSVNDVEYTVLSTIEDQNEACTDEALALLNESRSDCSCFYSGIRGSTNGFTPGLMSFHDVEGSWFPYCWWSGAPSFVVQSAFIAYRTLFCCYPDKKKPSGLLFFFLSLIWMLPVALFILVIMTASMMLGEVISLTIFVLSGCGCLGKYSMCTQKKSYCRWFVLASQRAKLSANIKYAVRKYGCCGAYQWQETDMYIPNQ
jgi:hypothetical protein